MKKINILALLLMPLVASCGQESPKYTPQIIDPVIIDDGGGQGGDDDPYEPWVPEIIDLDDPVIIEDVDVDQNVYDYSSLAFTTVSGSFDQTDSGYVSVDSMSMMVNSDGTSPFTHGTFAADIILSELSDSGIIFGVSHEKESDYWWEGKGISYYFFFISFEGTPFLGKTSNGNWYDLRVGNVGQIEPSENPVNLKILFYGNKIICFVNGEIVLSYRDSDYLTGTGYGFRVGGSNVNIDNIFISSNRVI